jgi:hypothetical protein
VTTVLIFNQGQYNILSILGPGHTARFEPLYKRADFSIRVCTYIAVGKTIGVKRYGVLY